MKTNEHNTKEKNAKDHREGLSELTWGLGDREGEGCVSYFPTGLGAPGGRQLWLLFIFVCTWC